MKMKIIHIYIYTCTLPLDHLLYPDQAWALGSHCHGVLAKPSGARGPTPGARGTWCRRSGKDRTRAGETQEKPIKNPWKTNENPWTSMKTHENPWNSMKLYENPWKIHEKPYVLGLEYVLHMVFFPHFFGIMCYRRIFICELSWMLNQLVGGLSGL